MGELLASLFSALVAAAGAIFVMGRREQKKESDIQKIRDDLNGQGKRMREAQTAVEYRALTVALTTIATEKDEQVRKWLCEKYLDGWRRP